MLNVPVLISILRIVEPSTLSMFTKKGHKNLDDFSAPDQLKTLRDKPGLLELYNPTTAIVTPLAHVMFKI